MKIERVVKETIDYPTALEIKEVQIGEKKCNLKITEGERLFLYFENESDLYQGYGISIDVNNGIRFTRGAYRPNHDHDDQETLQIVTGDNVAHKKGDLVWRSRVADKTDGYATFYVPFGTVTKSY